MSLEPRIQANSVDGSYKKSINVQNPLGMKGNLANAFAELLKALWKEEYNFLSPVTFRVSENVMPELTLEKHHLVCLAIRRD